MYYSRPTTLTYNKTRAKKLMTNLHMTTQKTPQGKPPEPPVLELDISRAEADLKRFMKTDEWLTLLGILGRAGESVTVHTWDDACSVHDRLYLTGTGFVSQSGALVDDVPRIVREFMMGIEGSYEGHRHPSKLIPWLKERVEQFR